MTSLPYDERGKIKHSQISWDGPMNDNCITRVPIDGPECLLKNFDPITVPIQYCDNTSYHNV